jgi:hypothetical protein
MFSELIPFEINPFHYILTTKDIWQEVQTWCNINTINTYIDDFLLFLKKKKSEYNDEFQRVLITVHDPLLLPTFMSQKKHKDLIKGNSPHHAVGVGSLYIAMTPTKMEFQMPNIIIVQKMSWIGDEVV